jgi:hypothetical protein
MGRLHVNHQVPCALERILAQDTEKHCRRREILPWQLCNTQGNVTRVALTMKKKNSRVLSPRANYTDRATAACQRSDCQRLRIEDATLSA